MKVKGILIVYLILCNSIISCKETEINTKNERKDENSGKSSDLISSISNSPFGIILSIGFIGITALSSYMCNHKSKCLISFGNDFFKWESEEKEK